MQRRRRGSVVLALFSVLLPLVAGPGHAGEASAPSSRGNDAARIVSRIVRADYEGDRAALARLRDELTPPSDDAKRASRVRYWRGFALWRRAINGFNDSTDPRELEADLDEAIREFEEALRQDPEFVDASAGLASSLGYLVYLNRGDGARVQSLLMRLSPLLVQALVDAPENPRLLWVLGPNLWYVPAGAPQALIESRQARTLRTYERALRTIGAQGPDAGADPLEPRWGEPELLMSLAWSSLNRVTPDPVQAERYAREALALVPRWHYVRDILMPQIQQARAGQQPR